jgi:hypothetical protein
MHTVAPMLTCTQPVLGAASVLRGAMRTQPSHARMYAWTQCSISIPRPPASECPHACMPSRGAQVRRETPTFFTLSSSHSSTSTRSGRCCDDQWGSISQPAMNAGPLAATCVRSLPGMLLNMVDRLSSRSSFSRVRWSSLAAASSPSSTRAAFTSDLRKATTILRRQQALTRA